MMLVAADILTLLGLAGATIAVAGVARSRSVYMQIHASTVTVMAGAMFILAATLMSGDVAIIGRAILVAGFLLLTTPVSGHAIARLEYLTGSGGSGGGGRGGRDGSHSGDGPHTNGASPG